MNIRHLINVEFRAVISYRIYSYIYNNISKALGYILYNNSKIKYSCDIAPTAKIGENFVISHIGGIVIGRNVVIGNNCIINNNVTIGMKNINNDLMPIISDNVYISTGAKILGNVYIGKNSIIGANSVVIDSFENNSIIVGIPGKKIKDRDVF